jgi:hypothetical protein
VPIEQTEHQAKAIQKVWKLFGGRARPRRFERNFHFSCQGTGSVVALFVKFFTGGVGGAVDHDFPLLSLPTQCTAFAEWMLAPFANCPIFDQGFAMLKTDTYVARRTFNRMIMIDTCSLTLQKPSNCGPAKVADLLTAVLVAE